ncbi:MAG: hypothetical protein K6A65_01245, partial [Succinivibrionaceae bacterium]|nr:hypothetical protein [Succinivibrionaceae bacterium]
MTDNIRAMLQGDHNLSLQQFEDLAAQSRDGQEIRIRKSDSSLTNTPLGIIARSGRSHILSNSIANHAFVHAVMHSERYRLVAGRLASLLDRTMPAHRPLTPERIRAVLDRADRLLAARELTDQAYVNGLLPTPALRQRFEVFAGKYLISHPEIAPDMGDTGDLSRLSAEERAQPEVAQQAALLSLDRTRSNAASRILGAFFSNAKNLRETGAFRLPASRCGNSEAKAELVSTLINRHHTKLPVPGHQALLEATIIDKMPAPQGKLLDHLNNAFSDYFLGAARDLNQGSDGQHALSRLSERDLRRLDASLSNAFRSAETRHTALLGACVAINTFAALRGGELAEGDFSGLVDKVIASLRHRPEELIDSMRAAAREHYLESMVASGGLSQDGQPVLGQGGISVAEGRMALLSPAFRERALNAITSLDRAPDPQAAQQALSAAASGFLGEVGPALLRTQALGEAQMPLPQRHAAINAALAMGKLLSSMAPGQEMGLMALRALHDLSGAINSGATTGAGRRALLDVALAMLPGREALGQLVRERRLGFAELLGGLHAVATDPARQQGIREDANELRALGMSIYGQMVEALGLDDAGQAQLELPPPAPLPAPLAAG